MPRLPEVCLARFPAGTFDRIERLTNPSGQPRRQAGAGVRAAFIRLATAEKIARLERGPGGEPKPVPAGTGEGDLRRALAERFAALTADADEETLIWLTRTLLNLEDRKARLTGEP